MIIWSSQKSAIWEDLSRHSSGLLLVMSAGIIQLGLYNLLSRWFSYMVAVSSSLHGLFCGMDFAFSLHSDWVPRASISKN